MQVDDDGAQSAARPDVPSRGSAGSEAGCGFLLAATIALLMGRIPIIFIRAFDNDEFEHTHAAWSVFRGLLPYKDFFEHHTPWYYFALSPFFRWFAVDRSFDSARHFLIFGRFAVARADRAFRGPDLPRRACRHEPTCRSSRGVVSRRATGVDPQDPRDPSRRAGADLLRRGALVPPARAARRAGPTRPAASMVLGWRALRRSRDHVHAEVVVRPSRHARGARALDVGGQAARVARQNVCGSGSAAGRGSAGRGHLARLRSTRRRHAIHLRQLHPECALAVALWPAPAEGRHDQRADPALVSRRRALRAGAPQPRPGASVRRRGVPVHARRD